jgi:SET domain-containing protein
MKLELRETPGKGRGVFALESIRAREVILTFGGELVAADAVPRPFMTPDDDHYLEVGRGLFLGPSGNLDDYVNHSCDPNSAVLIEPSGVTLVALLRDIMPGEEVTFDYSVTSTLDIFQDCRCGASKCRQVIGPYSTLSPALQGVYQLLGLVPSHVE